jgi:uncharacterized protein
MTDRPNTHHQGVAAAAAAAEGIFDAHTHVHPTAEAAAALQYALRAARNDPQGRTNTGFAGDEADAIATQERLGIRKMVLLPLVYASWEFRHRSELARAEGEARDPAEVRAEIAREWSAYNRWAAALAARRPDRFVAMIGLDPVLLGEDWARTEIEECLAAGASGIKLMPAMIGVSPSDERMSVVWELADRHALPVVSMSATTAYSMDAHPDNYEAAVSAHPRMKLILAHAGLGAEDRTAALTRTYDNVYVDTSAWFDQRLNPNSWHNLKDPRVADGQAYSLQDAADVFRSIGIDRVLFGTNYAIRFPQPTLDAVRGMPLTASEHEQIFRMNFRTVFDDWS